jgi:hypothetical protein
MTKFDRKLDNGLAPIRKSSPIIKKTAKIGRKYLVYYRHGKYYLIDLSLKKGGHSQQFK